MSSSLRTVCLRAQVFRAGSISIAVETSLICSVSKPENVALLVFNARELDEARASCEYRVRECVDLSSLHSLLSNVLDRLRGSLMRSSVKRFRRSKLHLLVPFIGSKVEVSSETMFAIAILEKALSIVRGGRFEGSRDIPIDVRCGRKIDVSSSAPCVDRALKYLVEHDEGVKRFFEELCSHSLT